MLEFRSVDASVSANNLKFMDGWESQQPDEFGQAVNSWGKYRALDPQLC